MIQKLHPKEHLLVLFSIQKFGRSTKPFENFI